MCRASDLFFFEMGTSRLSMSGVRNIEICEDFIELLKFYYYESKTRNIALNVFVN